MSENIKTSKTLDCVGLYCPEPLFQTREEMDALQDGEVLQVIADDPAAEEDIKRFSKRTGHKLLQLEKDEDTIVFWIQKKT